MSNYTRRGFRKTIKYILLQAESTQAEVCSGLLAIGWGLTILFPAAGDPPSHLSELTGIAPLLWGTFLVLVGGAQIIALVWEVRWMRAGCSFVLAPFYTVLAGLIAFSGIRSIGFLPYALFALILSFVYGKLAAGVLRSKVPALKRRKE